MASKFTKLKAKPIRDALSFFFQFETLGQSKKQHLISFKCSNYF